MAAPKKKRQVKKAPVTKKPEAQLPSTGGIIKCPYTGTIIIVPGR